MGVGEASERSRFLGSLLRFRHLSKFGRIALLAVVTNAAAAEYVVSLAAEISASAYLFNLAAILIIGLFALHPPIAALSMLSVIPLSVAAGEPGLYGLALVAVFGLVIFSCSTWFVVSYCVVSIVWICIAELVFDSVQTGGALATLAVGAVSGIVGFAMRAHWQRTQELQADLQRVEISAELAIAAERDRITDELHNIIAHELTVVRLQAHALPLASNEDERQMMIEAIIKSSDQALKDLRRMLSIVQEGLREVLDEEDEPLLEALSKDLEHLRDLGIEVSIEVPPSISVSRAVSTTLVHICSECTTNIMKHAADTTSVRVELNQTRDFVTLRFENSVQPPSDGPLAEGGYGLTRMTDRVHLLGGSMSFDLTEGWWQVGVTLPRF